MCPGLIVPFILESGNPAALNAGNERTEEYLVTPWPQLQGKLKPLPVQAQAHAYKG